MKRILTITLALTTFLTVQAQSPKAEASGNIDGVDVKVVYHSPSAKGRAVMGSLVPYGKVWRTGANNATTIEFSQDVKVEGSELKAGRYGLFTIPGEDKWTIIFNSKADQWGAFNYSADQDVLRVEVSPSDAGGMEESFKIEVTDGGVTMKWENTAVAFSVGK